MKDQSTKLSTMTVGPYLLLALAMIGMLVFGLILEDMPRGEVKSALIWWHKGLGVASPQRYLLGPPGRSESPPSRTGSSSWVRSLR